MKYTGQETLGSIVAEFPGAANHFKLHGIDFCCGGNRVLADVVAEMNLDTASVVSALNHGYETAIAKQGKTSNTDWRQEPLTSLIDHIVDHHHDYLHREMPAISELLLKILRVHGSNHQELTRVHKLFNALRTELEAHLLKEEELLYPLIKEYTTLPAVELFERLIIIMNEIETEHLGAGDILKELRAVTNQFTVPADACASYQLTYRKLVELESDVFQHIHLENNILHPRVRN